MSDEITFQIEQLNFYYGNTQALRDVTLTVLPREITALIGPSGCGKSTFLRCLNRMNDTITDTRISGSIVLNGQNIYAPNIDETELRRQVGLVFQRPNPFPQSIFDNVAFGPRVLGIAYGNDLQELVVQSLRAAALWDEIKEDLKQPALSLSLGQQQRLCIARVLAVTPDVILMDEPCSALDLIATNQIEELIQELKEHYTIVIVTHNMQQAARVSDKTGFFWLGELIEFDETTTIFTRPSLQRTEDYVTGCFG
ncbi:MAG: phosphate ABC transporter ATP-binding protein [Anaerolineaceae bacterium]|nr:phosphate ABC transporter ATP-binding protein [Anaerolineaceae bacterium]